MNGQFRVSVWDPKLLISQIVSLQAAFYLSFGSILILGSFVTGSDLTLQNIFNYKAINFADRHGVLTTSSYSLCALFGALSLWLIVKRTKLCLDFTCTLYFLHLLLLWVYNGQLPNTISWWILTIASITIMCVSGEFLCLRTEMQDIPLLGPQMTSTRIDSQLFRRQPHIDMKINTKEWKHEWSQVISSTLKSSTKF